MVRFQDVGYQMERSNYLPQLRRAHMDGAQHRSYWVDWPIAKTRALFVHHMNHSTSEAV